MQMKIGVIGAGNVGTAIARRLVPRGHQVMLSYSRDLAQLRAKGAAYGATTGTPAEAGRFADVVALAVPWSSIDDALKQAGDLSSKLIWDCTNALKPDLSGLAIGTTTSASEVIQERVPGAKVVKAIPPFAELLHSDDPTLKGTPAYVFVCGNDVEAKAAVSELVAQLPATPVDAGPLENARYVEPVGFLLVRLAYGLGLGSRIGLALTRG
jgi:8-hydroxy-5-deazaflavin:NADPH oxidoreductase